MKILALLLSLVLASAAAGDVVKTAKDAKSNRKKSRTPVITNEDLKKSKGTIVERDASELPPLAEQEDLVTRQKRLRRERTELDARLTAAETAAATLEARLRSLELSYYDEGDFTRRDEVLAPEFAAVSEQLAAARKELAAAQAELLAEPVSGVTPVQQD